MGAYIVFETVKSLDFAVVYHTVVSNMIQTETPV